MIKLGNNHIINTESLILSLISIILSLIAEAKIVEKMNINQTIKLQK